MVLGKMPPGNFPQENYLPKNLPSPPQGNFFVTFSLSLIFVFTEIFVCKSIRKDKRGISETYSYVIKSTSGSC